MSPISARVGASMAYSCSGDGPDALRVRELASDRELQSVSGGELTDRGRLQGTRGQRSGLFYRRSFNLVF